MTSKQKFCAWTLLNGVAIYQYSSMHSSTRYIFIRKGKMRRIFAGVGFHVKFWENNIALNNNNKHRHTTKFQRKEWICIFSPARTHRDQIFTSLYNSSILCTYNLLNSHLSWFRFACCSCSFFSLVCENSLLILLQCRRPLLKTLL